jgi:preprotein translocase subunit SecY
MTPGLAERITWTISALLLFRWGEWIPLPGVNPEAWEFFTQVQGSGIAAVFGVSSGGGRRLAMFALGLGPYVSAAVLVQLATIFSSRLRATARDGARGRTAMVRYARYLATLLAAAQAWGVANGLEHVSGVVTIPGALFIVSTVTTLTGGTMFLAWLAEQITARGIGNGIALILFAGVVTEIPAALAYAIELMRQYRTSDTQVVAVVLIMIAVTAAVVAVELARRKLPILYSARQIGLRKFDARLSYLSVKLNPAGIVPVLLASFVMSMFVAVVGFFAGFESRWVEQLRPAGPVYLILYALLIIFCTFFYTASVLDPEESADKLKTLGGRLETIEPGEPSAAYLDRVISRTALLGGVYLALVCLLPAMLINYAYVPLYFGGTALLITVCTVLDLTTELRVTSTAPGRR